MYIKLSVILFASMFLQTYCFSLRHRRQINPRTVTRQVMLGFPSQGQLNRERQFRQILFPTQGGFDEQFGFNQGVGSNQFNSLETESQQPFSRTTRQENSSTSTTTTTASPMFNTCMRTCQTTPQYNPVCGSDGVTYPNEARLKCAVSCGANVQYSRGGTCAPV